jgi:hypothetical protein
MIFTGKGNYVTETPENAKDLADLKRRFPHLPPGPVSYIPEKTEREWREERRDLLRAIYPCIRIPREY